MTCVADSPMKRLPLCALFAENYRIKLRTHVSFGSIIRKYAQKRLSCARPALSSGSPVAAPVAVRGVFANANNDRMVCVCVSCDQHASRRPWNRILPLFCYSTRQILSQPCQNRPPAVSTFFTLLQYFFSIHSSTYSSHFVLFLFTFQMIHSH